MATDKDFLIRVKADIKQATTDLKKVSGEISKTGKASDKADNQVNKLGKSFNFLGGAVAAYFSFDFAKRVILQADAYNVLQQRIKTATRATGDYVKVSRELFSITQANGVQLETTVSLFQNLARSAPELKATTNQMLSLTNVVQQLGVISGASDASLNAGLLQFSQGLSAGIFRAEEFNSLLENIPEVAKRIATGMGKTTGELRQMVVDGKVLSKDVFDSLVKQAPEIAKQFSEIPVSVERASTQLGTSLIRVVAKLDESLGLTKQIAFAAGAWARELDKIGVYSKSDKLKVYGEELKKTLNDIKLLKNAMSEEASLIDQFSFTLGFGLDAEKADREANKRLAKLEKRAGFIRKYMQDIINELTSAEDEAGDVNDSEGANTKPSKIDLDKIKRIEDINEGLKKQVAIFGKTAEEIKLYELGLLDATPAQIKLAEGFIATSNAQKEANKIQQEAAVLYADTRTTQEKLSDSLTRYDELLEKGAINWDTYSRAVFNANEEFDALAVEGSNAMATLIAATKGWGDQFTNTLADMVQTGKLDFKSLADSIISDLLRIAIQQTITAPILGAFGVAGFTAPTSHTGGIIGGGTAANKTVNPAVFLGAKRYHGGGIAGLRPNEVPTILERGEEVLTRNDPRHQLNQRGSGKVSVEIVKNGTPVEVNNANASIDIDGMVIKIIMDDMNRGGPVSGRIKQLTKER